MTWSEAAACRGMDADFWFPEQYDMATAAKEVCAGCPVRSDCLDANLGETVGIYGGLSPVERVKERRRRRIGAPTRPHVDGCECPAHGGRQTA